MIQTRPTRLAWTNRDVLLDGWTVIDESDTVFKIYECTIPDVTGDCVVDIFDFAQMAAYWLDCGDPFEPECL